MCNVINEDTLTFDTNQGAFNIVLSTCDWERSKISILEVEAVPQSWIPYVQTGLIIVL